MVTYEALSVMIAFATLIVMIISLLVSIFRKK